MTYSSGVLNEEGTAIVDDTRTRWPIHEVGRNADIFPEKFGAILPANSALRLGASHLHSNGTRETTAHLGFGFIFHPTGYTPEYGGRVPVRLGNGSDIDVPVGLAGQESRSFKAVTFSPDQMKAWMDTRVWGNSPWSPPYILPETPPDNQWVADVTFHEPGDYVLRAVASDGSHFTYENVTIEVTR